MASFEVTAHFEISARGGFVVGHLREGIFRNGMLLKSPTTSQLFAISGIEFLDNITERTSTNALVFREKPTIQEVQNAFPVGTLAFACHD